MDNFSPLRWIQTVRQSSYEISRTRSIDQKTCCTWYLKYYVPPTLFDRDVNIKSKVTGERLTSQRYLKEYYHEMKSKAKKMLETKKSKEIEPANIMIRTYVTYGYPSDKILEFSNKHQVNLIVIGSMGLTGFSRIKALSSVARSISERAKGPVMIVR